MLAHVARSYDRGYGHFTTRQNIQFHWIKLERVAGRHGRSRQRRHARHADQRQLRAQHHHRPMGRRCARRDRGPAHLGRAHPPARDAASRILVHAAQVQDRGRRRGPRSRRAAHPRSGAAAASQRRRRNRLRGHGRRRARPHAVPRQDHQAVPAEARRAELRRGDSAHLQPVRPARQYLQGAHQDPGARARRRSLRQGSRGGMAEHQGRRAGARSRRRRRNRRPLPLSRPIEQLDDSPPELAAGAPRRSPLRRLGRQFGRQSQGAGLRHRHACRSSRKAARRATPPPSRWTPSPISPTAIRSAKSASATSRIWCCRMSRSAICRRCGARSTPSASPRRMSGSSPTSSPARASIIAASPMRARSRSRRRSRGASAISIWQRDLGRLHINISGCINACGHHHVGHIGILGVEKNGEEFYQITLGGKADEDATLGTLIGPAVPYAQVADVVEDIAAAYLELRAAAGRVVHRHRQADRRRTIQGARLCHSLKTAASSRIAMCASTTMRRSRTACRSSCRRSGFWPMRTR